MESSTSRSSVSARGVSLLGLREKRLRKQRLFPDSLLMQVLLVLEALEVPEALLEAPEALEALEALDVLEMLEVLVRLLVVVLVVEQLSLGVVLLPGCRPRVPTPRCHHTAEWLPRLDTLELQTDRRLAAPHLHPLHMPRSLPHRRPDQRSRGRRGRCLAPP